MVDSKQKVAVLGGGISALTTAFELAIQGRYDITVYQLGWRLGGKGASGRNLQVADRIEEHGLHIWFGFYENSFDLIRRCYQELQQTPEVRSGRYNPYVSARGAFSGQDSFIFADKKGADWASPAWKITMPGDDTFFPGEPSSDGKVTVFPSPWEYLLWVLEFVERHFRNHLQPAMASARTKPPVAPARLGWLEQALAGVKRLFGRLGQAGESELKKEADRFLGGALKLARALDSDPKKHEVHDYNLVARLLADFKKWLDTEIDKAAKDDINLRRAWILVDLSLTTVTGMLLDNVPKRGFNDLNDLTFRQWLAKHGADPASIDSPPVQAFHDAAFAYEDGDASRPNMAAGVALRALMRILFTYKGHIFYKMNAGMGDIIFAPLYLVLKAYGVKFKFFHRVQRLALSPDQNVVSEIHVTAQVDLADGKAADEYEPLINVHGLPCWPNRPDQGQIVQDLRQTPANPRGVDLESRWADWKDAGPSKVLKLGRDFDIAVLGLSLGPLPFVCGELIERNACWRAAVRDLKTVKTQAVQLWFQPGDDALGWPVKDGIVGAYAEPYASWADFSQLQGKESWPPSLPQGSVFYCCNAMPDDGPIPPPSDHDYPQVQREKAQASAMAQLRTDTAFLWDRAANAAGGLNWDRLTAPSDLAGEERATRFQYFRANIDPSERYVLSLAGAESSRIRGEDSGFDNLYAVGTWTDNGFNLSSIEAAVMSGMKSARAISGFPKKIVGESDFPEG